MLALAGIKVETLGFKVETLGFKAETFGFRLLSAKVINCWEVHIRLQQTLKAHAANPRPIKLTPAISHP